MLNLLSVLAAGSHVLDEAERSLHDALCVLNAATADSRVLYGGGWPEMQMAKVGTWKLPVPECASAAGQVPPALHSCGDATYVQVVDEAAARTPGKRSLAMAAFARSLRAIPTIISDNAGT
jgi:T-complex protein 1 subunit beta